MAGVEKVIILMPVYNDWESFGILISELNRSFEKIDSVFAVVVVNDCSDVPLEPDTFPTGALSQVDWIKVIHLYLNMGHQRAIAVGLAYIHDHFPDHPVIVMDADGEDTPVDVLNLLAAHQADPQKVVLAQRARRSENLWFRLFYFFYKLLFRLLTGREISFGNFSLLPASILPRIVRMPEVWNHYAGALLKSKVPLLEVPADRGTRYSGKTHMRFVNLVLHGLSGISIYLDIVIVRMLIAGMTVIGSAFLGFLVVIYIRFFTSLAIPGWATNLTIGLGTVIFQAVILLTLLTFVVLNQRTSKLVIPAKDYQDFIDSIAAFYEGRDVG